ncbi:MAG TPA: DUF2007 domain-containing protein [Herpetosiphonaceae bacterium]
MEDALPWHRPIERPEEPEAQPQTSATTRFGGDGDDAPVLVAVVSGPVEIEMANDALQSAGIPAYVKRNSLGPLYGLSIGSFGSAEIWVPPALAEQAYNELVGIGVVQPGDE